MTFNTLLNNQSSAKRGFFSRACNRAIVFVFMPCADASSSRPSLLRRSVSSFLKLTASAAHYLLPIKRPRMGVGSLWPMLGRWLVDGIYVAGIIALYLPSILATIACIMLSKSSSGHHRTSVSSCIYQQRRVSITQSSQPLASARSSQQPGSLAAPVPAWKPKSNILAAKELDLVSRLEPGGFATDAGMDRCSICLDCASPEIAVRVLNCGHGFHAHCIDTWLTMCCALCPLCKTNFGSNIHTAA
ncbi:hypothetical protein H4R22_000812 [Coemansia sp. RSA 1290]|nr:hypothetical protein H4R22_000812 [Coemansia sp. RSA 1290]KAJ2650195.1 hypothetical protein IWW40_002568 [Coemansia sp. RSA 1250]